MSGLRYLTLVCVSLPWVAMAQTSANPVMWPQPESFYSDQGANSHRSIERPMNQQHYSGMPPVTHPSQWNTGVQQQPMMPMAPPQPMGYASPMPWGGNGMPNMGNMPNMNNFSMPYPNSVSGLPNPMDPMGAFTNPVIPSMGTGTVNPMSMWPGGMMGNGLPFGFGR